MTTDALPYKPDGWRIVHDPDANACWPWHLYPDSENGPAIGKWETRIEAQAAREVLNAARYTPTMWLRAPDAAAAPTTEVSNAKCEHGRIARYCEYCDPYPDSLPFTVPTCDEVHERRLYEMGWQLFPYIMPGTSPESRGRWVWCPPGERVHISTARPCPLCAEPSR